MPEHTSILSRPQVISSAVKDPISVYKPENENVYAGNFFSLPIQRKLSIGAVDDPLEDEADAMADKVMRMPEQNFIQRKCSHCEEEEKLHRKPLAPFIQRKETISNAVVNDKISNQIQSTRGSGHPLTVPTKSFMESRFGTDFSPVNIHTGSYASQLSKQLNAQAFTVGNDIYFNEGKYAPETDKGKHLLAHELTHTIQQTSNLQNKIQRRISPNIGRIRDRLSYHIFSDWAITNAEVRQVLQDLNPLSTPDLRDTVRDLEGGGYISRLYENLAESSDRNLQWVQVLMQRIQSVRAVRSDVGNIRSLLSYGFFDWAITDEDVSAVLLYLRNLSNAELAATIASLEQGGYVDRLYENLGESDERKQSWVSDLMERIQRVRVHSSSQGGTITGTCTEYQINEGRRRLNLTRNWAQRCIDSITIFIHQLTGFENIRSMLDRYFFHQAETGVLTAAQQNNYAEQMIQRLNGVANPPTSPPIICASPFDLSCGSNTLAYVPGSGIIEVHLCQRYFNKSDNEQISILFHELMHAYNRSPHVGDTGYGHERIFRLMPPGDSILNADSYTAFAIEVVLGNSAARAELRHRQDSLRDCSPQQRDEVLRNIAYATRMLQNAINQIQTPSFGVQNSGTAAATHFHATQSSDLIRFKERFEQLQNDYAEYSLSFTCEHSDTGSGVLPFIQTNNYDIRLKPAYFAIAAENTRTNILLAILFKNHFSDMNDPVWASQPAYNGHTIDQAYRNPASFTEYARQLTNRSNSWDFGNAEVRYHEQAERIFTGLSGELLDHFNVSNFNGIYLASIQPLLRHWLTDFLRRTPVTNQSAMQTLDRLIRQKFLLLQPFLYQYYDDYSDLWLDTEIRALVAIGGNPQAFNSTHSAYALLYASYNTDLLTIFTPVINQIITGTTPASLASLQAPLNSLRITYRQRANQLLQLAGTYQQYIQQLFNSRDQYDALNTQIFNSLTTAEQNALLGDFVSDTMIYNDEFDNIMSAINTQMIHNVDFRQSRRRNAIPTADSLLTRHRRRLNQLVLRRRRRP